MKKIIILLIIFSVLMTLSSCGVTSEPEESHVTDSNTAKPVEFDYEVVEINGSYYMVFDDEGFEKKGSPGYIAVGIEFESLAEMKRRILNNELTVSEKTEIYYLFGQDENGYLCPDLYSLYDPSFPFDYKIDRILWTGEDDYIIEFYSLQEKGIGGMVTKIEEHEFSSLTEDLLVKTLFDGDTIENSAKVIKVYAELDDNGKIVDKFYVKICYGDLIHVVSIGGYKGKSKDVPSDDWFMAFELTKVE